MGNSNTKASDKQGKREELNSLQARRYLPGGIAFCEEFLLEGT
jgi:hypothetical protein